MMFFACAAMLTLASCNSGNKTPEASEATSLEAVNETEAVDENAPEALIDNLAEQLEAGNAEEVSTLLQDAQSKYESLIEEGKTEEAASYMKRIQNYIAEHASELTEKLGNSETITTVLNAVKALPADAGITKEEAMKALEQAKTLVTSQYGEKAGEAIDKAKEMLKDADMDEVAEKVKEAASNVSKEDVEKAVKAVKDIKEAKDQVDDAVNEAKSQAKKIAGDAAGEAASKALDKLFN